MVANNTSVRFDLILKTVIKAVTLIRADALNTRVFKQLYNENDELFERFLLCTEVRWLSDINRLE